MQKIKDHGGFGVAVHGPDLDVTPKNYSMMFTGAKLVIH
jgi:hypothetical protein